MAKKEIEITAGVRDGHIDHPDYEKPAGVDTATGDINADLLSYIGGKGIVHEESVNLPYSAEQIHAAIAYLKGQGKLQGDGSRIWA